MLKIFHQHAENYNKRAFSRISAAVESRSGIVVVLRFHGELTANQVAMGMDSPFESPSNLLKCKRNQIPPSVKEVLSRSTILVKLQKEDPSQLQFEPGDHIGIFPCNEPKLVEDLLKNIQDVPEKSTVVKLESRSPKGDWGLSDRLPVCSVWNAFSRYLDITTPPSPQLLKLLAQCATNNGDKAELTLLSEGSLEYDEWKNSKMANIVEVLNTFSSIRVELSLLLSQLPFLQCRYYSISSSPDVYPDQIHCTISVFSYRTEGGKGQVHHGVCSTFMDQIEPGEKIACFIRQDEHALHLSWARNRNCSIQKLLATTNPFYAESRCSDQLYKEEVEEAIQLGALTDAYVAYSRSDDVPKTYVQHLMADIASDYMFDTLTKHNGHMYVCGDVTMAADVLKAVGKLFEETGNMTASEAKAAIKAIKTEKRYHEDIFGVTLRTKEVTKKKFKEAFVRRSSSLRGLPAPEAA